MIVNSEKIKVRYTDRSNSEKLKFVDLEKAITKIRTLFDPAELTVSKCQIAS